MNKSQLINILKTFSAKDIREMRKWLHSPAHNQRQDVIQLFDYFFENNHLAKEDCLEKPYAFSWIYPKETYDDAKMRQVMFFLLKAIEDFLIYQELYQDEINAKNILSKAYRKRKLDKLFEKNIKQSEQLLGKATIQNEKFYLNEYQFQLEKYNYLSRVNRLSQNLQEVSNTLDIVFLTGKLRQYCLMLSHQSVYQKEYTIGLLKNLLPLIQQEDYIKIPAIASYYFIYKTLTEKEDEIHFFQLKEQIKNNGHLFPLGEIRDIYLMTINYCIGRMNAGLESFMREAFELYQLGFEKKILIDNNSITRVTFHNVISIGLKLKEYTWVENFIEKYQYFLEEKHREGFVYYSLARLFYEKKNYTQAMRLLVQDVQYDDILIFLNSKILLSWMYYEEGELDALDSLTESMRTYIQRKKIMGYHKVNYKNYLKLLKKLIRIKPNKNEKEKLSFQIKEANPLTPQERKWLLTQLSKI
jgi:hypothetical protein